METESIGVKEVKEVLVAVNSLSLALISTFKDGLQVGDVFEIVEVVKNNEELRGKLMDAYEGISKVPAEIADIDAMETIDLVIEQAKFVPKLIAEFLKK